MAVGMLNRRPLRVLIAAPRGFCAGVDRAIQIVELALERFGAKLGQLSRSCCLTLTCLFRAEAESWLSGSAESL